MITRETLLKQFNALGQIQEALCSPDWNTGISILQIRPHEISAYACTQHVRTGNIYEAGLTWLNDTWEVGRVSREPYWRNTAHDDPSVITLPSDKTLSGVLKTLTEVGEPLDVRPSTKVRRQRASANIQALQHTRALSELINEQDGLLGCLFPTIPRIDERYELEYYSPLGIQLGVMGHLELQATKPKRLQPPTFKLLGSRLKDIDKPREHWEGSKYGWPELPNSTTVKVALHKICRQWDFLIDAAQHAWGDEEYAAWLVGRNRLNATDAQEGILTTGLDLV